MDGIAAVHLLTGQQALKLAVADARCRNAVRIGQQVGSIHILDRIKEGKLIARAVRLHRCERFARNFQRHVLADIDRL